MTHVPRAVLALCLAGVVVVGLAVQLVRYLPWADAAGSVLYAMAAGFAIALVWRRRPAVVATAALVACVLVELAQLTGLPARLPALRLLIGSGFDPRDIAWYVVGALVAGAAMALAERRAPTAATPLRPVAVGPTDRRR